MWNKLTCSSWYIMYDVWLIIFSFRLSGENWRRVRKQGINDNAVCFAADNAPVFNIIYSVTSKT